MRVTLLDRNNYHQFQPLLYQVATSQLASSDIAFSLRKLSTMTTTSTSSSREVESVDPATRTVTLADGDASRAISWCWPRERSRTSSTRPVRREFAFPLY